MKTSKKFIKTHQYKPFDLTVSVETVEEYELLKKLFSRMIVVPQYLHKCGYLNSQEKDKLHGIMTKISNGLA